MKTLWFRNFLRFSATTLLIAFAACSSPKRSTEVSNTSEDGLSQTPVDTSGYDDLTNSSTSPTGTPTTNLFDNQVGSQDTSLSGGPSQLSQPTGSEMSCLSNAGTMGLQSFGQQQSTGTGQYGVSPTNSIGCFNPGAGNFNNSTLFNASATSYQTADYCLQQAIGMLQFQPGSSQFQIEIQIRIAELSLLKCKRDLIEYQQGVMPWGGNQMQAFQHADYNLSNLGQQIW